MISTGLYVSPEELGLFHDTAVVYNLFLRVKRLAGKQKDLSSLQKLWFMDTVS